MLSRRNDTIRERFADVGQVSRALHQAVQEALLRHKQAGHPVCVWREGKVVWIPPEEIPVSEAPNHRTTS